MGCAAHLILVDPCPGGPELAIGRLRELESRWSRFLPDSDLSRLNRAEGAWTRVSRDTQVLIATMKEAHARTGGLYDPTFVYELLAIGYVESIEDAARVSISIDMPCFGRTVDDAEVDDADSSVRLPIGLALDAGGIGKGLAADLIVGQLLDAGTTGALVSIGGDLCAAGTPPDGIGWDVDIADPTGHERPATRLRVSGGGVATSSTLARRTIRNGISHHHVIDPATRLSAATDLATVSTVAGTGWEAEAHATAALIGGSVGLARYAATHAVSAFGVTLDGSSIRSNDLEMAPTALLDDRVGAR